MNGLNYRINAEIENISNFGYTHINDIYLIVLDYHTIQRVINDKILSVNINIDDYKQKLNELNNIMFCLEKKIDELVDEKELKIFMHYCGTKYGVNLGYI